MTLIKGGLFVTRFHGTRFRPCFLAILYIHLESSSLFLHLSSPLIPLLRLLLCLESSRLALFQQIGRAVKDEKSSLRPPPSYYFL